jgi:hypothetical protein
MSSYKIKIGQKIKSEIIKFFDVADYYLSPVEKVMSYILNLPIILICFIGYLVEVLGRLVLIASRAIYKLIIKTKFKPSKAPGTRLLAIVEFLFRRKTVELTFTPLISDWQTEYFEALSQKRKYKARWIMIQYYFHFARTFIRVVGLSKVLSVFKQFSK